MPSEKSFGRHFRFGSGNFLNVCYRSSGGYGFRIIEVSFPLERKRRHLLRQTSFRQFGYSSIPLFFQAGKQLYADVLPVGIRFEQFFDLGQGFYLFVFG